MSTPYEQIGRTRQKARTRAAMVDAARALLARGITPTVEEAAEQAAVSRTTAYRYFPNRRALLAAAYPEIDLPSLLGPGVPETAAERLELVLESFIGQTLAHEAPLRATLRLSLEPSPPDREALPLRQGRGIAWIDEALAPLALSPAKRRRLALAIRATVGIEALVWLTDVGGLDREAAAELMRDSARTLLAASS